MGVVAKVVVCFLWLYYYVASTENLKAKAWQRVCRRHSLSNRLSTRIHNLLVSTPQIAPTGGTIVEVKFTLQLHG